MHTQYMMHSPRLVLEYSVNIKHVLPILICPDKWGPDKINESYLGFFNQTLVLLDLILLLAV